MGNQDLEALYPPIEPFETGALPLTDGHTMAWQRCGNPVGYPVLVLHGGPGGSVQPYYRQLLDPALFCGVFYDQRGCGDSTPVGSLEDNNLQALIEDIERLREYLGIDQWIVLGGSWGSTLALAYAESYPASVSALVVSGVYLARDSDREWFWGGVRTVYPDAWEELIGLLEENEVHTVRESYTERILCNNGAISVPASLALMKFECSLLNPEPDQEFIASVSEDVESTVRMARIYSHYDQADSFLEEGQLIEHADALRGIPGRIINGRLDMCTPSAGALDLARAWPSASLSIVEMAGHRWNDPRLAPAVVSALKEMHREVAA